MLLRKLDRQQRNAIFSNLIFLGMIVWAGYGMIRRPPATPADFHRGLIIIAMGFGGLAVNQWIWQITKRQRRLAATRILDLELAIYGQPHEYAIASIDTLSDADRAYYEGSRRWFVENGFHYLADSENLTLARVIPKARTIVRSFVSDDGTILAAAYLLRTKRKAVTREYRAIEFESELSNGTFITTSNARLVNRTLPFPGITAARLGHDTPPEELLRHHQDSLQQGLADQPEISVTHCQTIEDAMEFQRRMQELKSRHKQATGYVSAADLEANRQRPLTSEEKAIAREIERLKVERKLKKT